MKNLVTTPANKFMYETNRIKRFSSKNIILKIASLFVSLITIHNSLFAQATFTTKISAPKIGIGQRLEVSYEMTNVNSVDNFTAPNFPGFTKVGGPMQSTENSVINGKSSSKSTISFFLQPQKTGKLTIAGAQAVIDGKSTVSNNVTVDVQTKDVDLPQNGPDPSLNPFNDPFFAPDPTPSQPAEDPAFSAARQLRPGEDIQKKIDKNLFIKVYTNKTTVYEGEPIVATYKVYTRFLDMNAGVTKRPSFSGFSAFDMEDPSQSGTMEQLNGQNYLSYIIRKVQLYPLQSGQLILEPVEVDCDLKFIKLDHINDPNFNQNDPSNQKQLHYVLKSQPVKITALPFPEQNKPNNFKGAVGNFTIQAVTSAIEIGKDDAEKLQITITGNGNFSAVQAPDVTWPASIEAYDPKQKDNLDPTVSPMSGTKTFEYVFICHKPGKDTIPAIEFSYFDVASKTYKTITTNPFFLSILPQSKHPQKNIANNDATDIPEKFVEAARYALPLLAIGLLIFLVFSLTNKKKKKQIQKVKEKKMREDAWQKLMESKIKKQEPIVAKSHENYMPIGLAEIAPITPAQKVEDAVYISTPLAESDSLIWQGDDKAFFQALKNDILKALGNAANVYGASKSEIFEKLRTQGKDENVLQQLKSLLDECDAVAYSPMPIPADRHAMLEEAKFLLGKI